MNDYNPFPQVTDVVPFWVNSGVCYSRAAYTDEAVARKVGEHVRAQGGTVNGGMLHGMRLGSVAHMPAREPRPYSEIYPEGSPLHDPNRFTEAVPESWEVTY